MPKSSKRLESTSYGYPQPGMTERAFMSLGNLLGMPGQALAPRRARKIKLAGPGEKTRLHTYGQSELDVQRFRRAAELALQRRFLDEVFDPYGPTRYTE